MGNLQRFQGLPNKPSWAWLPILLMDLLFLAMIPVTTALIGWVTNKLAIRMLFHPRKPRKWLGITVQGLIPRRQGDMARRLGEVMERDILKGEKISRELEAMDIQPMLNQAARDMVWKLGTRLKSMPLVGGFINDPTLEKLTELARQEMKEASGPMKRRMAAMASEHLPVRRLVEDQVNQLDMDHLEKLIHDLAGQEFRHIEWLGGILGFLVGVAQVGLILILR